MEKKPLLPSEWIPPIVLGILSVIGILVIIAMGRQQAGEIPQITSTITPYRFIYLGTEPGLSTQTPENTPTPIVFNTPTSAPTVTFTPLTFETSVATNTALSGSTITPTIPFVLSKLDDTDIKLTYSGDWVIEDNATGAHHETLHVSSTVGNSVTFDFKGQQVIIAYQAGPSLGTISINLNGLVFDVSQSSSVTQFVTWESQILVYGTYTVIIEHAGGGSVNIDSVTIPDLSTSTPTPTQTPTPTLTPTITSSP